MENQKPNTIERLNGLKWTIKRQKTKDGNYSETWENSEHSGIISIGYNIKKDYYPMIHIKFNKNFSSLSYPEFRSFNYRMKDIFYDMHHFNKENK